MTENKNFIPFLLKRLLILTEVILLLRLALKFLGANPAAVVVGYFYSFTDFLIGPFKFIFANFWLGNNLIESATLSAIVGYAIIVFLIIKIIRIFSPNQP